MTATVVSKSDRTNMLEGMFLITILQGLPNFAGSALLLRLFGSDLVAHLGGAAVFVGLSSLLYGPTVAFLAPKLPKLYANVYAPVFFDTTLSISEKATQWRMQPAIAQQQMVRVIMLSLLVVVVLSVR